MNRAARAVLALLVAAALFVAWQVRTGGPLRAQFDRDVAEGRSHRHASRFVLDRELAGLPEPVQRYLTAVAAVGAPYPWEYRVRFRGRLRSGPDAPWMQIGRAHV